MVVLELEVLFSGFGCVLLWGDGFLFFFVCCEFVVFFKVFVKVVGCIFFMSD